MHGMQTRGSKTFKNCFFRDNIKQRYNFNISPLLLLQNYFLKFSPIESINFIDISKYII